MSVAFSGCTFAWIGQVPPTLKGSGFPGNAGSNTISVTATDVAVTVTVTSLETPFDAFIVIFAFPTSFAVIRPSVSTDATPSLSEK